ncbi:exotoxin beta-grasp domain-containing protein [Staphylococcus coagulans]|uniref:exotoxin beta-grasp domain-containing protein n=1 Tax=Staphylococcus coagulans TaxID=74706 RepID=UPI0028729EDD|nr:exotoxin beta-grasp domain-containing protein [Staphylococcus coagulans]MDR9832136.1 exotoxin beta-grasp domain-containing protein [Staphylococcus coagulans]
MKKSTIIKVSLAVGILTTGVGIQSHAAAFASEGSIQFNKEAQDLKSYYSKSSFEYKNITGYKESHNILNVINPQSLLTSITLDGKDLTKYQDDEIEYSGLDVFIVPEGSDRSAVTKSIGGITKTNKGSYYDYVKKPDIVINRKSGELTSTVDANDFAITKEEVSLKELDFKLRQKLIKEYGLYENGVNDGKIVIKLGENDNEKMTIELNKKLQQHRMSDTIDVSKIKKITIDL